MDSLKVLVVEDEPRLAEFLGQALRESGYVVTSAGNGQDAIQFALTDDYSAVVLDVMLPDTDGFQVLSHIRSRGNRTPVLMLTARTGVEDRIQGLDAGADDYLGKPFELAELLARLRALQRRGSSEPAKLSVDDLEVDPATRRVRRGERKIDLSAREFALLEYLLRNKGRVMTKTLILERVWDDQFVRDSNVVEVYINYLRSKIEQTDRSKLIHTVRGVGYVMELREDVAS